MTYDEKGQQLRQAIARLIVARYTLLMARELGQAQLLQGWLEFRDNG
jgi:hypothetical protein